MGGRGTDLGREAALAIGWGVGALGWFEVVKRARGVDRAPRRNEHRPMIPRARILPALVVAASLACGKSSSPTQVETPPPYWTIDVDLKTPGNAFQDGFSGVQWAVQDAADRYSDLLPGHLKDAMDNVVRAGWVRFPGGTPANAHDWETGEMASAIQPLPLCAGACTGFQGSDWVRAVVGADPSGAQGFLTIYQRINAGKGYSPFSDFVGFAQRQGVAGRPVVLTVNAFTDTPAHVGQLVRLACSTPGLAIRAIELVNEAYLDTNKWPTGQDYVAAMAPYVTEIGADVTTGSCAAAPPLLTYTWSGRKPAATYAQPQAGWDAALVGKPGATLHEYPLVFCKDPGCAAGASESASVERDFLVYTLARHTNATGSDYWSDYFGAGRKIVVSELNVSPDGKSAIAATHFAGIFLSEYIARAASSPRVAMVGIDKLYLPGNDGSSLVKLAPPRDGAAEMKYAVEAASCLCDLVTDPDYRAVCNTGTGGVCATPQRPENALDVARVPGRTFVPTTIGQSIAVLNACIGDSRATAPTTATPPVAPGQPEMVTADNHDPAAPDSLTVPGLYAQGFVGKGATQYVMVVNKGPTAQYLQVSKNGAPVTPTSVVSVGLAGGSTDPLARTSTVATTTQTSFPDQGRFRVDGYSVNRVEFE